MIQLQEIKKKYRTIEKLVVYRVASVGGNVLQTI